MTPPTPPGSGITASCSSRAPARASFTTWRQAWPQLNLPAKAFQILRETPTLLRLELRETRESYYDIFELMVSGRRPDIAVRGWIQAQPPERTESLWITPDLASAGVLLRQLTGLPPCTP